jgi:hypothetical protein
MNETAGSKQKPPFRKLKICAGVVAVITVFMGGFAIPEFLMPTFEKPLDDYVITGKWYNLDQPLCLHVRRLVKGAEDQPVFPSASLYKTAYVGDHLQMDGYGGYMRLIHAGRVVGCSFSDEQKQLFLFVFCAMFPVLVFVPFKNRQLTGLVLTVSILCELVVIGMMLFVCLFMLGLGHNC